MKKGLLGCLLVGIVLIVVGAGLAWWFVLRPMVGAGNEIAQGARDWARAVDAEQAIVNQAPFTAPADGRLTQEQVNDFVAVQSNLQLKLGGDFDELRRRYEQMQNEAAAGATPALGDLAANAPKLAALVARAREAQVEAINRTGLSLAEYRWIREQAYAALPFLDMDPDAIVAPKPPPGFAVDAATGELIEIPEDEPLEAVAIDGEPVPLPEDDGLEYAGTAPEEIDALDEATPAEEAAAVPKPAPPPDSVEALGTVADRGLGDDRALDDAPTQAARANAVLLRPHKDLLLATLAGSWAGL